MADEIEIKNVGGNGVASEVTLARLQRAMEKLAAEVGKDKGSQAAKLQQAHEKALKLSTAAVNESTDAYEDNTSAVKSASRALGSVAGFLGSAVMGALSSLTGSVVGVGRELVTGSNRLSDFAQHVPLVGGVLSSFTGILDQSIDQLRAFSGVGASFNNDFEDMIRSMLEAEMPFDEFAQTVISNSQAMAALGSSVTNGTIRFAQMGRDLRTSDVGAQLMNMGFSVSDINEGLARYTLLQARSGRLQSMSNDQLIAGTSAYLKEVDALAKATGMQRDEAMEAMLEQQTDAQIRAVEREIEARGGNVDAFRAQIGILENLSPELKGAFRQLIDGVPDDEMGEALMAATNGQAGALMQQVRSGEITTQEFYDRLRAFGPQIEAAFGDADLIGGLRRLGHPMAQLTDSAFSLLQMQDKNLDEITAEQLKRDAATSSLLQFEQAMNSLRTQVLMPLVNAFFPPFKEFMDNTFTETNIQAYVANFKNFMTEFSEDPKGKLKEVFTNVSNFMMDWMFGELDESGQRLGGFYDSIKTTFVDGFTNLFNDPELRNTLDESFRALLRSINDSSVLGDLLIDDDSLMTTQQKIDELTQRIERQAGVAAEARASNDPYAGYAVQGAEAGLNALLDQFRELGGDISGITLPEGYVLPQRRIGTLAATGRMSEPQDTIAKIHAGERVLNPQETKSYNEQQSSPAITTMQSNNQEGTISAINQLNSTMSRAASVLEEIKSLNRKQLGATKEMGAVY